ncbi:hypothetical protein [Chromobacterium amazonense]|uniref:hypothetical protein n=1 Tax=Chromobacterium amazonense TaxID=1382803 RepID=UPI0021B80F86|nr:hypothetical protein [Chromobacterium amazonense]MBM2884274.1 hypothetical protein [Chromobacterium amazonense]
MSISSNTSTYWQQLQSLHQQRRQDFNSLTQSVQQGDIAGAQQALAALQQLNGPNNTGNGSQDFSAVLNNAISAASATSATGAGATATNPFAALNNSQTSGGGTGNSISSLLNTLGQDLQSGNLSQAQQAFQQLQQGLQQANGAQAGEGGHRHHHHHHDSGGEQNNGLANLLNGGNQQQSAAAGNSAGSNAINQQAQAALSLYQASGGNNDISSLLMSLSV